MLKPALPRLLALADDELILAQRNAEWVGHAPILEEDIALANLAQDELGHATVFYGLIEQLSGQKPDKLVFFRDADAYRCAHIVELPKGDWAFTMLRQYLFDAYEYILYDILAGSTYQPLADSVAKMRKEEIYHLRHTHTWVERLGLGSAESNRRMQAALDILWPHCPQLMQPVDGDVALGIDTAGLYDQWQRIVVPHLADCELTPPAIEAAVPTRTTHTPHLAPLLADLQLVARTDPEAVW